MNNNLKVEYYKGLLLSTTQKVTNGKSNIAKPILLLAIIELVEQGHIIGNKIKYDEILKKQYRSIFRRYAEIVTQIEYPYYYMRNDGFYSLKGVVDKKTPSNKYLLENIEYAYFDDCLWDLMQKADVRNEFKQSIIKHYLTRK